MITLSICDFILILNSIYGLKKMNNKKGKYFIILTRGELSIAAIL
ncbi:hypothetical protein GCM10027275_46490 [Rhabdobacter roseus]